MNRYSFALVLCLLAPMVRAEEGTPAKVIPSPDKKWEYRLVENKPAIVDTKTGATALDLDVGTVLAAETGRVVWAPDSRRLAFNFRAGGHYFTCAIYELTGDEWKALPDLETEAKEVTKMMERAEQRDLKRLGLGKDANRRGIRDEWKVRRWIDRDTFEAVAFTESSVMVNKETEEPDYIGGAVVFTVKCDNQGGWKVIHQREPSAAELQKIGQDDEGIPSN